MKKIIISCVTLALMAGGATGCSKKLKNKVNLVPTNTPTIIPTNTNNAYATGTINATAFHAPLTNNTPLNITRVVQPTGEIAKEIQKAFDNTNKLRAEKGLPALKYDESLAAFAQMRAAELSVTKFGHTRPNGELAYGHIYGSPAWTMENAAAGNQSADETVLRQWRNSSEHYAAITNSRVKTLGIGLVYDPNSTYKYYWIQMFGFEGATLPFVFINANQPNPKPLEQVVIGNTTIPINLATQGQWQSLNNQGWINGYTHSRFGLVNQNLFYQGNQTADTAMPKIGTAVYHGTGLMVKNDTITTNLTSQLSADFGKRTLTGTLSQNGNPLYRLNADINGSGFASKPEASTQTQGAFFGDNAQELSGVFKDTQTNTKGVFGAKR